MVAEIWSAGAELLDDDAPAVGDVPPAGMQERVPGPFAGVDQLRGEQDHVEPAAGGQVLDLRTICAPRTSASIPADSSTAVTGCPSAISG